MIEKLSDFNLVDVMLFTLTALITMLLGAVVYFVKRQMDKTDERFNSHSQKHDNVQVKLSEIDVRLSAAMTKNDATAIYDWTASELSRMREQDIAPVREDLSQARLSLTQEIRIFDTKLTETFASFRTEIREDMKLIIGMLRKSGD